MTTKAFIKAALTTILNFMVFAEVSYAQSAPVEAVAADKGQAADKGEVGLRLDCSYDFNRNRGGNQDCIQISGLRFGYTDYLSPKVMGSIRLDPFGTTAKRFEKTPVRSQIPSNQDTKLGIVDDYKVEWSPRPLLHLSLRKFQGVVDIPSASDLTMDGSFQDSGWNQTALAVDYRLPALSGINVLVAVGNGEGENGQNLDPQQYVGFRIETEFVEGVRAIFGMSSDGNNVGSDEYTYLYSSKERPAVGFSTQRLALGVMLDGKLAMARGLKVGFGWQRASLNDLDKDLDSVPPSVNHKHGTDPGSFIAEDSAHIEAESIKRTVYEASFSYRILDRYFLGADYEIRQIAFEKTAPFQVCRSIANDVCDKEGETSKSLNQAAYTVGLGFELTDGMQLVFDYQKVAYDKLYDSFNFSGHDGAHTDNSEIFNARLSYNWN